jgi:malonate decarboxylase delta subunit
MEQLRFRFEGGAPVATTAPARVVGVVASGNLEVLIETAPADAGCAIEISTAARGFGAIWQAVMADFHERHRLAGVRVSINDAGATPAIVTLRLDQAVEAFMRPAMGR